MGRLLIERHPHPKALWVPRPSQTWGVMPSISPGGRPGASQGERADQGRDDLPALFSPAGYEAIAMLRKGQVRNITGNDIRAQATFIAGLFQIAA
jgi:hypothetical protein